MLQVLAAAIKMLDQDGGKRAPCCVDLPSLPETPTNKVWPPSTPYPSLYTMPSITCSTGVSGPTFCSTENWRWGWKRCLSAMRTWHPPRPELASLVENLPGGEAQSLFCLFSVTTQGQGWVSACPEQRSTHTKLASCLVRGPRMVAECDPYWSIMDVVQMFKKAL